LPDPSILDEILLAVRRLDDEVWAKPSDLEPPLRIQQPQLIERGSGEQMYEGTIEKGTLRQAEIGAFSGFRLVG
jgi:hypothetical protein